MLHHKNLTYNNIIKLLSFGDSIEEILDMIINNKLLETNIK